MRKRRSGMAARNSDAADSAGREIVATRLLNAPRALVWAVWTDPKHVAKWWGPNGFTNTIREMDVKPGGRWRFTMHGPDGTDYENEVVFTEIVKPSLLAYDHVSPKFHVTVTFAEEGGKTRLVMRMLFDNKAERDDVAEKYGAVEGLNQTLNRLAGYVGATA
jgi:uncharacterized protein YndB with AHSA1/START domain